MRVEKLGLGILVVLAVLVASSATASASGTPEWFECIKAKGVGTFEKGCAVEGGKGGYIAQPDPGGTKFRAHGAVTLGAMECSSAVEGTEEPPNLLVGVRIQFGACHRKSNTKDHCEEQAEKEGPKEATFESEALSGELGYISHSPLRVGLKLEPVEEGAAITPRLYCIGPA